MAKSIYSIQQGASGQIGLSKPLYADGTQLMDIKAPVPMGCGRKKKITVLARCSPTSSAHPSEPSCAPSFSTRTIHVYLL